MGLLTAIDDAIARARVGDVAGKAIWIELPQSFVATFLHELAGGPGMNAPSRLSWDHMYCGLAVKVTASAPAPRVVARWPNSTASLIYDLREGLLFLGSQRHLESELTTLLDGIARDSG